jgi:hypothetical protein
MHEAGGGGGGLCFPRKLGGIRRPRSSVGTVSVGVFFRSELQLNGRSLLRVSFFCLTNILIVLPHSNIYIDSFASQYIYIIIIRPARISA